MAGLRRYANPRMLVHHGFQGSTVADPVTTQNMFQDGLIVGLNTANPMAATGMVLRYATCHSGCIGINTAGAWTMRLRKNESLSDSATASITCGTLPGSKEIITFSSEFRLDPGDSFYCIADGPSRNTVVIRLNLYFEVL